MAKKKEHSNPTYAIIVDTIDNIKEYDDAAKGKLKLMIDTIPDDRDCDGTISIYSTDDGDILANRVRILLELTTLCRRKG